MCRIFQTALLMAVLMVLLSCAFQMTAFAENTSTSSFRTAGLRLLSTSRETSPQAGARVIPTAAAPGASTDAVHLVFNGDFAAPLQDRWRIAGKTGIEPRIIPVQIESEKHLTRALQLELSGAADANPWDVVLQAPASPSAIAKDSMIAVQFWARSNQPTRLNAIYQQSAPSFEKTIRQVVEVPVRWQKFTFFAPAKSALAAGNSNFELQLGQTAGTFEVTGIRVTNLGVVDLAEAGKRFASLAAAPAPITGGGAFIAAVPAAPIVLKPRKAPPYIVLKLDDLAMSSNGVVHPRWQKLVDFIKQRQIKASLGIVTNSLEGDKPKYFNWLKEQHATGLFEFWDHGYTHKEWEENGQKLWEFKGPSYEEQKEHLMRSQALAREKLGFTFPTFGAPFNFTDDNTVKALSEIPEVKIWLYGDTKNPAGKIILQRPSGLGIENPLFVPSLERFIRPYNNLADHEFFVIQGHPAMWDDARFANFVKIIDFLMEQKAVFVTPSELVTIKNLKP